MSDSEAPSEPSNDELQQQLDELRAKNQEVAKELAQYGRLDPSGIMLNRLEVLLQAIFDEHSRLVYEIRFETMMEGVLQDALAEGRKQQLVVPPPKGAQLPPNLGAL